VTGPSRRALLVGAAAIPVVALAAAVPYVASASANGAAWYSLKARYDAARSAIDHHNLNVRNPAEERYFDALPPAFDSTLILPDGTRYPVSIEYLKAARFNGNRPVDQTRYAVEVRRVRALLVEHQAADEAARIATGFAAADAEADRLSRIMWGLEEDLISTPAPDSAALLWKLEQLRGDSDEDRHAIVLADARRLSGREG
jgi:hypothetical protein